MTLQCVSRGGYPQYNVTWHNGTVYNDTLVSEESVTQESDGTFTVLTQYTFTPTLDDNMTTFVCQSSYDDPAVAASTSIDLYVGRYKLKQMKRMNENTL